MIGRFLRALVPLVILFAVPATATAPAKPRLIVTLVVDQFAADLFQQYRPSYTGGLKRLADGVSFVNGYQSHAATETCPGHATILTGRHPAASGIVANEWFDRASGKSLYCVALPRDDPKARGPQNLRVDTLGTWLKASEPGAQVVSVSGKDRAAIMLAGRDADAVYWWGDEGFVTSRAAGPDGSTVTGPARQFHASQFAAWAKTPPALWPADVPARCVALERPEQFGAVALSGHVPPDGAAVTPGDKSFADQLAGSPLFDRLALDFAGRLIATRHLGRGRATDLLAVSLSATDYIGHRYGKGGPEMCAQLAALDQALGQFFARLDALKVPYVVVLTADHGSSDAAERAARNGSPGSHRLDGKALLEALNAHLRQTFALAGDPIKGGDLQDMAIQTGDPALDLRVRAETVSWLQGKPDIAQVLTRDQVAAAAPPRGTSPEKLTMAERFHEGFDPARSGDVFAVVAEHVSTIVPRKPGDAVAGHGSPWDYDRRVPILFWWPGAAGETVIRPIETVDIAPTLAAIAGVRTPRLDGRCLPEVAECPAP
jgi:predicted AlkP superfamily pyrophosphatase or phosphodiesterase